MTALKRRLQRLLQKVARVRRQIRKAKQRPTQISDDGVAFIAEFEGLPMKNGRAYPYDDPAVPPNATIGYGHLIAHKPVNQLTPAELRPWKNGITQAQALHLLKEDLAVYSDGIRDSVSVRLTQNQFDALVSFAYNNGLGAWISSTLRRKVNGGRPMWEIRSEFSRWVNAGSPPRPLPGLVRRRKAEADLFFSR